MSASLWDAPPRVWKFSVPMPTPTCRSWIDLPNDGLLLGAGIQGDDLIVWALVPQDASARQTHAHRLIVANTGNEIPGFPREARFLGTVESSNGIVWHIWDGDGDE